MFFELKQFYLKDFESQLNFITEIYNKLDLDIDNKKLCYIIIVRGDTMQDLSLSYCVHVDNYFDPQNDVDSPYYEFEDGIYNGWEINEQTDYDEVLSFVKELRSIIKKDFLNILKTRIKYLNNNEGLIQEFHRLIDTIVNGIDFDVCSGRNFFFF